MIAVYNSFDSFNGLVITQIIIYSGILYFCNCLQAKQVLL